MRHASSLKQDLALLGAETEVGFRQSAAAAERVRALVAELESMNPTPEPARAAGLLRGHWKLLYSDLDLQRDTTLSHLSFGILPKTAVQVAELFNQVNPATGHWDNVISFADARTGMPGQVVMSASYEVAEDDLVDLRFTEALVSSPAAPVRLPIDGERLPLMQIRLTYLDDGFRIVRGSSANLYIMERLDTAPMRWARDD